MQHQCGENHAQSGELQTFAWSASEEGVAGADDEDHERGREHRFDEPPGKKGSNFHEWNNRINRLTYDFVVCAKDWTVLAAIELDDKSHDTTGRAETDRKKERATSDAGLGLIRWHVRSLPDETAILAAFTAQPNFAVHPAGARVARSGG